MIDKNIKEFPEDYLLLINEENPMKKSWYQSKTVWLAIAQGVLGVMTALTTANPELATIGWIATGKSLLDMFLRFGTIKEIH